MTLLTGFLDNFGRTVSNGWGTPDNAGGAYTVSGTVADWSVGGGFGVVTPSALGTARTATSDANALQWNMSVQWKLSALPASGTVRAGLIGGWTDASNYYRAYALVTSAGAVSVVIEKVVAGTITAVFTGATISGLTIAAGTLYGFRFGGFYNFVQRQYVLAAKVWATTGTEPYGWAGTATDGALFGGTQVGCLIRNDGPAATITFSFDVLAGATHGLPYPASADPMCYDPSVAYPRQTVAQSLAAAIDTYAGTTIDPDAARAASWPRVRISKSSYSQSSTILNQVAFDTVEYNVGTPTDLTVDPFHLNLSTGIWLVRGELVIPSSTTMTDGFMNINNVGEAYFRINAGTGGGLNDPAIGAANQLGGIIAVSPGSTTSILAQLVVNATSGGLSFTYYAMMAQKLADYFT